MRAAFLIFILSALAGCGGNTASSISNSSQVNQTTANNSANSATIAATSQTVTVDSPDGVKIVGSLFESAKPNSPAVLLLHQWQSDRHSYDDFAKRLQAKGFTVLSIDGRGFGDSTKKADGTAVTAGRSDVDVKAMLGDVECRPACCPPRRRRRPRRCRRCRRTRPRRPTGRASRAAGGTPRSRCGSRVRRAAWRCGWARPTRAPRHRRLRPARTASPPARRAAAAAPRTRRARRREGR